MDHTSIHWNGLTEDFINEVLLIRLLHGLNATLRESQIDGLGEVQRDGGRIAEVYMISYW